MPAPRLTAIQRLGLGLSLRAARLASAAEPYELMQAWARRPLSVKGGELEFKSGGRIIFASSSGRCQPVGWSDPPLSVAEIKDWLSGVSKLPAPEPHQWHFDWQNRGPQYDPFISSRQVGRTRALEGMFANYGRFVMNPKGKDMGLSFLRRQERAYGRAVSFTPQQVDFEHWWQAELERQRWEVLSQRLHVDRRRFSVGFGKN